MQNISYIRIYEFTQKLDFLKNKLVLVSNDYHIYQSSEAIKIYFLFYSWSSSHSADHTVGVLQHFGLVSINSQFA